MRFIVLVFFFIFTTGLYGQTAISISCLDIYSYAPVVGAEITLVSDTTFVAPATDEAGDVYIDGLADGDYRIVIRHPDYIEIVDTIEVGTESEFIYELEPSEDSTDDLDEVVITNSRKKLEANIESTEMGSIEISKEEVEKIPSFLGEPDILKTAQLLPGVSNGGEGTSGFFVRGGSADQNLITIDGAKLYSSGHLFGFFSIINNDVIDKAKLIKGDMPAEYGERLASVLAIKTSDGSNTPLVKASVGIVNSKLYAEGPLVKDKLFYSFGARRTYLFDLVRPAVNTTSFKGTNYFFYDLNGKLTWRVNDKNSLSLTAYNGLDKLIFNDQNRRFRVDMPWGSTILVGKWDHTISDNWYLESTVAFDNYQFNAEVDQDQFNAALGSGAREAVVRTEAFHYRGDDKIVLGVETILNQFTPNSASGTSEQVSFTNEIPRENAQLTNAYASYYKKASDKLLLNLGLRASHYTYKGPDTLTVVKPQKVYQWAEPRVSARYKIDSLTSIKASWTNTRQIVHLVTNSSSTLPFDVWVPSDENVAPQISNQFALGYFKNFANKPFTFSTELYYKYLQNQIEYNEFYVPNPGSNISDEFVFGTGYAYGAEVLLRKQKGKLQGWLGYTWSRSRRRVPAINQGREYPVIHDRTHDGSLVLIYEASKKWSLGSTFVYATGNTYTPITSVYFVGLNPVLDFGARNSARELAYHRLDFSATLTPQSKKSNFQPQWVFSIYNVYNRQNTFLRFYEPSLGQDDLSLSIRGVRLSIFPVIPSVSYKLTWHPKSQKAIRSSLPQQ